MLSSVFLVLQIRPPNIWSIRQGVFVDQENHSKLLINGRLDLINRSVDNFLYHRNNDEMNHGRRCKLGTQISDSGELRDK